MWHFKKIALIFICLICVIFVGCSAERGDEKAMNLDIRANYISYRDEQLSEIEEFSGSMNNTTDLYKTNYIEKVEAGYRIIYRGETKILKLIFDDFGNKVADSVHSTTLTKSAFDTLCVGSSLSEVRAIDPNGEYLFLYTGRNDIPRISMHYTTDGFVITITYDKNNVIEKMDIVPM